MKSAAPHMDILPAGNYFMVPVPVWLSCALIDIGEGGVGLHGKKLTTVRFSLRHENNDLNRAVAAIEAGRWERATADISVRVVDEPVLMLGFCAGIDGKTVRAVVRINSGYHLKRLVEDPIAPMQWIEATILTDQAVVAEEV